MHILLGRSEILVPNDKKEDGMSISSNTDALTADDDSATKRKKSTSSSFHKKDEVSLYTH